MSPLNSINEGIFTFTLIYTARTENLSSQAATEGQVQFSEQLQGIRMRLLHAQPDLEAHLAQYFLRRGSPKTWAKAFAIRKILGSGAAWDQLRAKNKPCC